MARQRSKPGAVLGWELDQMIPANATPLMVAGQLVLYSAAERKVYFAEACILDEFTQPTPATPPGGPTP